MGLEQRVQPCTSNLTIFAYVKLRGDKMKEKSPKEKAFP